VISSKVRICDRGFQEYIGLLFACRLLFGLGEFGR